MEVTGSKVTYVPTRLVNKKYMKYGKRDAHKRRFLSHRKRRQKRNSKSKGSRTSSGDGQFRLQQRASGWQLSAKLWLPYGEMSLNTSAQCTRQYPKHSALVQPSIQQLWLSEAPVPTS
jgi:hypothetical protein